MQGQVGISGQTMQNDMNQASGGQIPPMSYWTPNPNHTFSMQQNTGPIISVPALRPPRSTVTSTVNINGNPRMSSGVTRAPTSFRPPSSFVQTYQPENSLQRNIGSMEYDYNS